MVTRTKPWTTTELVALFGVTRPTIHRWSDYGYLEVVGMEAHNSLGATRLLISPASVERTQAMVAARRAEGKRLPPRAPVHASTE